MPPYWQFWIGLVAGGVVGGGSISFLFFRALVDRLREIFQTREEAEARQNELGKEMHELKQERDERFAETEKSFAAIAADIRKDLHTGIGSVGAQIAAQSASHGREMGLLMEVMKESKTLANAAKEDADDASHKVEMTDEAMKALSERIEIRLKAMEDKWDLRLGHIEYLLQSRPPRGRAS